MCRLFVQCWKLDVGRWTFNPGAPVVSPPTRRRMAELWASSRCRLGQMLYTVAFPRRPTHDPQRAHQDAGPQGPDDRRLLARGRADLLAAAGAEAGLRFRSPTLGVH